jgi:Toprim domain
MLSTEPGAGQLSNFRTENRCFNCDYKERGSDGPWSNGVTDQGLIWDAEGYWNSSIPFIHEDAYKIEDVIKYLKQRCVFDLALKCDQLRASWNLNRALRMRAYGNVLVGRIWHVRKGFIGIHATKIDSLGIGEYERAERRTAGACQGGAVWFGTVTPDIRLVVGEGIETVLSAMILWGAEAGAATLGTEGLKSLVLPEAARRIVIAADNDLPGPNKKIGKGLEDARIARRNWLAEDPSIDVAIKLAPPPLEGEHKRDWNDVLMGLHHV